MTVVLIGFKNCGKTRIGQKLAHQLGWEFIDTDQQLCAGLPVREFYQQVGEQQFRAQEAALIHSLKPTGATVIATGGGSIQNEEVIEKLAQLGTVIYLQLAEQCLQQRAQLDAPQFIRDHFTELFHQRVTLYEQVADLVVNITDCSEAAAVNKICEVLNG